MPCEEDNEGPDDDQNGHHYRLLTTNKPHHGFRPVLSGHCFQVVLMQSVGIPSLVLVPANKKTDT